MNYLAHSLSVLHCPYRLAGTALPDWLRVAAPGVRLRPRHVDRFSGPEHAPCWQRLAQGVLLHHRDDGEFHFRPAFLALCEEARLGLQARFAAQSPHVVGFLAHLLVELLLDAAILDLAPEVGRRYYAQLERLDRAQVGRFVHQATGKPVPELPAWIDRFCRLRFLFDYLEDGKLWFRCGQVMRRLGCSWQDGPPPELVALRRSVYRRRFELLPQLALVTENPP